MFFTIMFILDEMRREREREREREMDSQARNWSKELDCKPHPHPGNVEKAQDTVVIPQANTWRGVVAGARIIVYYQFIVYFLERNNKDNVMQQAAAKFGLECEYHLLFYIE